MIIKKYKIQNKIRGYISTYFDDNEGVDVFAVYAGNPNKGNDKFIGSFYDKKACEDFADGYFTQLKKLEDESRQLIKAEKKLYAKRQQLIEKYSKNYTQSISENEFAEIDRILQEYAFRLSCLGLYRKTFVD